MSLPRSTEIPAELIWELAGRLKEGEEFVRTTLFDELVSSIPKEPQVRALVYHSELAADVAVPWHIHNGPIFALLLQGEIILQFPGEAEPGQEYHYKAGDVFVEPIGAVHRAINPNPAVPMISLAFQLTPPDRDHIVNVSTQRFDHRPRTAQRGVPQPQAELRNRLEGSRE